VLLSRLELVDDRTSEQRIWSVKISLGVIALLIVSAGGEISAHVQGHPGQQYYRPDLWDALTTAGPFLLAVGVYKIGAYIAVRHFRRAPSPAPTQPASVVIGN
jgi:hypothetical protein